MNKLTLKDLKPIEAHLKLSSHPEKILTLRKFTLNAQIWVAERFGKEDALKEIFASQKLAEISEIAFYLLKNKDDFKTLEDFREAIVTYADKKQLLEGLLHTIGVSQPLIDDVSKEVDAGNEQPLIP